MSLTAEKLVEMFQQMYREHWNYIWGKAETGTVDCSGALVYVYEKHGLNIYHGSNRIARSYVTNLQKISKSTRIVPGMVAFKTRDTSNRSYDLPDEYRSGGSRYNGDIYDYYHIGVIDEDTDYVLNAEGTKNGFTRKSLSKGWTHVAYLKAVDYSDNSVSGGGGANPDTPSSGSSVDDDVFSHHPLRSSSAVTTSPYGERSGGAHYGVDYGVPGNPDGTVVVQAVAPGKVSRANYSQSYGNVVYIEHEDGMTETRYAHLHSLSVSTGDIVSAGTMLGYMGTTGDSSNPHLHFEVRIYGNPVNPATLVPAAGSSSSTPAGSNSSIGDPEYDVSDIPYTPVSVVGMRASQIASQPLHAYVKIYIGDRLLTTEPPRPNIQRMTVTRIDSSGTNAEFSIFDPNWDEIESVFTKYYNNVVIEYGYVNQKSAPISYRFMLSNYSIDCNHSGTILNVSALSMGPYTNLSEVTITSVNTYNPTEAVRKICEYMGWRVGELDETVDVKMDNPFTVINTYPVTYIQSEIIPLAQTQNGEILQFNLDDTVDPPIANFTKFTYETPNPRDVKTYVYRRGYDSVVQSLSFDIDGVFGGATELFTASGLQSGVIDTKSKQISYHAETNKTAIMSATGTRQHILSNQSIPYIDPAGNSEDQINRKLYYSLQYAFSNHYKANMTIIGDTSINIGDHVRLINLTDKGLLHHTSGIYDVTGIVDTISNGSYLTTLKLMRNGSINEGVELISPKVLVK